MALLKKMLSIIGGPEKNAIGQGKRQWGEKMHCFPQMMLCKDTLDLDLNTHGFHPAHALHTLLSVSQHHKTTLTKLV